MVIRNAGEPSRHLCPASSLNDVILELRVAEPMLTAEPKPVYSSITDPSKIENDERVGGLSNEQIACYQVFASHLRKTIRNKALGEELFWFLFALAFRGNFRFFLLFFRRIFSA